jgi:ribosomal protein S15
MGLRNHFITDAELEQATNDAFALTTPAVGVVETQMSANNTEDLKEKQRQNHVKVVEALQRITSLENSSARDRFHVNVRRVVDELGRHNTDGVLKPKPQSIRPNTEPLAPRAGPDTGSSEVQIGILTAKIRNLAKTLEVNRGRNDKHNKRNLRVLLHKRQKLLRYMHAKERGSERWTNMVEKLGITPAMWQGQIDL